MHWMGCSFSWMLLSILHSRSGHITISCCSSILPSILHSSPSSYSWIFLRILHSITWWAPTVPQCSLITFTAALGNGWAAAVLDTQEEVDFIKAEQIRLGIDEDYWIGGFTDREEGKISLFPSQYSSESGRSSCNIWSNIHYPRFSSRRLPTNGTILLATTQEFCLLFEGFLFFFQVFI